MAGTFASTLCSGDLIFSYGRQLNFIPDFSLANTEKEQGLETFVVVPAGG